MALGVVQTAQAQRVQTSVSQSVFLRVPVSESTWTGVGELGGQEGLLKLHIPGSYLVHTSGEEPGSPHLNESHACYNLKITSLNIITLRFKQICRIQIFTHNFTKNAQTGFPGGAMIESPPADAGDTGSCPVREDPTCRGAAGPVSHGR